MDTIKRDDLTNLLEQEPGLHISMFMPLEWEPEQLPANHIHLKNLIKQGQQRLQEEGFLPKTLRPPENGQIFQPAQELLQNGRIAVRGGQSLAIYLTPESSHIYTLSLPLDEQLIIAPRFYIRPLLPLLNDAGHFYLLTFSQNQVQLWRGNQYNLEPIEVPTMPQGMAEALAFEDPERSLQFHTSTGPRRDERAAVFHGHDSNAEKKGAVLRYLREVNDAIEKELAGSNAPLFLAAVAYLHPLYQEANTYPHLMDDGLTGNLEHLNDKDLHQQAWNSIQLHFQESQNAAVERYQNQSNTDKTSQSVTEIVPAAAYGQVDTLFIASEGQEYGRFNPDTGEVKRGQSGSFDCEDLLNLAAAAALTHGSTVYTFHPDHMPTNTPLAAILRYTT